MALASVNELYNMGKEDYPLKTYRNEIALLNYPDLNL